MIYCEKTLLTLAIKDTKSLNLNKHILEHILMNNNMSSELKIIVG